MGWAGRREAKGGAGMSLFQARRLLADVEAAYALIKDHAPRSLLWMEDAGQDVARAGDCLARLVALVRGELARVEAIAAGVPHDTEDKQA